MTRRLGLAISAFLALTACGSGSEKATLQKNTIACKLRQDFVNFQTMYATGDERNFLQTYQNAMQSGSCKRYLAQTDILVDKSEKVGGRKYSCIRVAEEASCYWMEEL
jgi:hypothetical protein